MLLLCSHPDPKPSCEALRRPARIENPRIPARGRLSGRNSRRIYWQTMLHDEDAPEMEILIRYVSLLMLPSALNDVVCERPLPGFVAPRLRVASQE